MSRRSVLGAGLLGIVISCSAAAVPADGRQWVETWGAAQMVPGQSMVAVRVNPDNPQDIAIDLSTEPPTITMKREGTSAAEVLATGTAVRAVIVQSQPLGMKNPEGLDVYAFQLTVMPEGQMPYQIQVGNAVPAEAVPLLYPGSNVPAKVLPGQPNAVAIDWQAALAGFTKA